jgi:hypothetical protein
MMVQELKKEMSFRLLMGYSLAWCMFGALLWYIISFTQNYGWQVSTFWFLTGGLACIMRFLVYDLAICLIYWIFANQ